MTKQLPFIYLFKTFGEHYLYDVNKDTILRIPQRFFEFLTNYLKTSEYCVINQKDETLFEELCDQGFLSCNTVTEILHPVDDLIESYLDRKLRMITLQITQLCNFNCSYCTYSQNTKNRKHSDLRMDINTAKKSIDFYIKHAVDMPRLHIGFYGGEPLIEFRLIKECIEYAKEKAEGKEISFGITTNGSLISDEVVDYFSQNNVNLVISLDGPKEMHDKNRRFAGNNCGTFEVIMKNLEKIRNKYPEYYQKIMINAVIDPDNDFECSNEFFVSYDVIKDAQISMNLINDLYSDRKTKYNDDFNNKYDYEFFKCLLHKLNKLNHENISPYFLLNYEAMKQSLAHKKPVQGLMEKDHHSGPCVPGVQRPFVNVFGEIFPCERVSEVSKVMKIGHVETGFNIDKIRQILNVGKLTEESCKKCWAFRHCGLCAAHADNIDELSSKKKLEYCGNMRRVVESKFKDYCTLYELGDSFEDGIKILSI